MSSFKYNFQKNKSNPEYLIYLHKVESKGNCTVKNCPYCTNNILKIKNIQRRKRLMFHLKRNPLRLFFAWISLKFQK